MVKDLYLDALAALPLFAALSPKDLKYIAKFVDEVNVDAGRSIISEGQVGHEAYLIQEGTADVERNGQRLTSLGPGDNFGELAVFDQGPRTATVTSTSAMRLLVIGQRELVGVVDQVPGIGVKILGTLAGKIRRLDEETYG